MSELVPTGSDLPATTGGSGVAATHDLAVTPKPGRLASERVIINAPMSFAGAAQRASKNK